MRKFSFALYLLDRNLKTMLKETAFIVFVVSALIYELTVFINFSFLEFAPFTLLKEDMNKDKVSVVITPYYFITR